MEMRAISDSDLRIRFLFTFAGSKLFHWHNADFNIAWHSDWKKCCCEITVPKKITSGGDIRYFYLLQAYFVIDCLVFRM